MLKALLRSISFYAFTTLNLIYAYRALKREAVKLAETEKASNKWHYVAIRMARGEYNISGEGLERIYYDFKFNDVAAQYHAPAATVKFVRVKPQKEG
jgi:hypothetical protein